MTSNSADPLLKEWKAEEIAPFTGWDFSRLSGRLIHDTPPWSYKKMARELLSSASSALDLGTSGGERLLEFKDVLPARTTATEGYRRNFVLAKKRLRPFGIEVVECNDSLQQVLPFKDEEFDPKKLEAEISRLMEDEDVTKKKGIYIYVLDGKEKHLNIRAFSNNQKREAYGRQKGICPVCSKHFEIDKMEGDHITPWHEGGKTIPENCQMLCKEDNRRKSGK